jgi:hypothetical protein
MVPVAVRRPGTIVIEGAVVVMVVVRIVGIIIVIHSRPPAVADGHAQITVVAVGFFVITVLSSVLPGFGADIFIPRALGRIIHIVRGLSGSVCGRTTSDENCNRQNGYKRFHGRFFRGLMLLLPPDSKFPQFAVK